MNCKIYYIKKSNKIDNWKFISKLGDMDGFDLEVTNKTHFELWSNMLWEDYNFFLVLDSEIEISYDNMITFLKDIKKYMDVDKELILIGFSLLNNKLENPKYLYSSSERDIRLQKLINRSRINSCSFGYLLNCNIIYKLVSLYHKSTPSDDTKTLLKLDNIYFTSPQLVITKNKHTNFIFYSMKDIFGNDIKHMPGKTVDELMDICLERDDCMGFNTYGYLKNSIDKDNLMDLPGTYDKNHGIYIKIS